MHRLVIVTGASGAGKTTILNFIRDQKEAKRKVKLLHFDSIGVPSVEEMKRDFGSGENWQRVTTINWLKKIKRELTDGPVLFEGQMRIAFIAEGMKETGLHEAKVVLFDCCDSDRAHRLSNFRDQPELNNEDMTKWASFLRREAKERGVEIIDTSKKAISVLADEVLSLL